MTANVVQENARLDWSVVSRPLPGETMAGDLHLIKPLDYHVLLAVIDGVGHGSEAVAAARVAIEVLDAHAREPLIALFKRCHEALVNTRGVVMTLVSVDTLRDSITWLGVGGVEGRLLRADRRPSEGVILRNGLVGFHLPSLQESTVAIAPGDLLILATDGIRAGFTEDVNLNDAPRKIADRILERHFKGNDDALVFVGRYLGLRHE